MSKKAKKEVFDSTLFKVTKSGAYVSLVVPIKEYKTLKEKSMLNTLFNYKDIFVINSSIDECKLYKLNKETCKLELLYVDGEEQIMKRLTKKDRYNHYYTNEANCRNIFSIDGNKIEGELFEDGALAIDGKAIDKLGQIEDIEEELKIDLITLFKALKQGIYYHPNYLEKHIGYSLLKYDETKIYHCSTPDLMNYENSNEIHLFLLDASNCEDKNYHLKDYKKTWALTKEELEVEE